MVLAEEITSERRGNRGDPGQLHHITVQLDLDLQRIESTENKSPVARTRSRICASPYASSRPRIVPVEEANLSVSKPMRCSIETNKFGSG